MIAKDNNKHQEEAMERWGHTGAYRQSVERTKNWTDEDYRRVHDEQDVLLRNMVINMEKGPKSDEIRKLVELWRAGINRFYNTTPEMCRGLANMYVEDERFGAFYKKYHPDLPQFIRDAINYYCDTLNE